MGILRMSRVFQAFLKNESALKRVLGRYVKSGLDVDDLAQETFLKAFAAEITTEIHDAKAFLFRVARNLALSKIKSKIYVTTVYLEDAGGTEALEDCTQGSVEGRIDGERKLYVFSKAVAQLPLEYQRAFLMRKVENLKLKQIATRLNVSVSTVEKRVAKALLLCDSYLRQQGYDPEEFGRSDIIKRQISRMDTHATAGSGSAPTRSGRSNR